MLVDVCVQFALALLLILAIWSFSESVEHCIAVLFGDSGSESMYHLLKLCFCAVACFHRMAYARTIFETEDGAENAADLLLGLFDSELCINLLV